MELCINMMVEFLFDKINKMKTLLKTLLTIIVIIIIIVSCSKDELSNNNSAITNVIPSSNSENHIVILDDAQVMGPRIGEGDLIFFRQSMTTDNYLAIRNNVGRVHKAYNSAVVAYVQFDYGLDTRLTITSSYLDQNGKIQYFSTNYKHYKALVMFRDSTKFPFDRLTVFTKDTIDHFRYYPTGSVLKPSNDDIHYVEWRRDTASVIINNDFRLSKYLGWVWNIYRDGVFFEKKLKEPINILSNQFQPDHKN